MGFQLPTCPYLKDIYFYPTSAPNVQDGLINYGTSYVGKLVVGTKTLYLPSNTSSYTGSPWTKFVDNAGYVISKTL